MISVLIPLYNWDVSALINNLHEQLSKTDEKYEILIADDFSTQNMDSVRENVEKLNGVRWLRMTENLGRSKVRNFLAGQANYDFLLFIDCDASCDNPDFIRNYLKYCDQYDVICGGTRYLPEQYSKEHSLRWEYGMKREMRSANQRNIRPYESFSSFNFLIKKDVFMHIRFDESIRQYGHEDTLLGIHLKKKAASIKHVENALIHRGLEGNETFVRKTEQAIDGLIELSRDQEIKQSVRILRKADCVGSFGKLVIKILYFIMKPIIGLNLRSRRPSLRLFDFYKLALLIKKRK